MDRKRTVRNESNPLGKPQVYVHLEFGVSWSESHTPRTHTVTYTSRNLKDARSHGRFPRQVPLASTNYLATDSSQQPQQSQNRQRRVQDRLQQRQDQLRQQQWEHLRADNQERRRSRSESRGSSERGFSAPPPFHGSPWDASGPSASLFPPPARSSPDSSRICKPLPSEPSRFRLGTDGLPWQSWVWPAESNGSHEEEEQPPFANQPTTVDITSPQPRDEDPERVRELESLSAAMMTVDNGFENQWWNQGHREVTDWWPRDQAEPSRLSISEAALLTNAEPPFSAPPPRTPPGGWYAPSESSAPSGAMVSPLSSISSPERRSRGLSRSLTTRSEELFMGGS